MCKHCIDEEDPCCANGKCTAAYGDTDISYCVCCGAEMQEVNGLWYHYSQLGDGVTTNWHYSHGKETKKEE